MSRGEIIVLIGIVVGVLALVIGFAATNMARRGTGGAIELSTWMKDARYWRRIGIGAVILVALFILYLGAFAAAVGVPNLVHAGTWHWSQAFWLVIAWFVFATCIAAFAKGAWRTGLQATLAVLVIAIFASTLWTAGLSQGTRPSRTSSTTPVAVVCPDASVTETRSCGPGTGVTEAERGSPPDDSLILCSTHPMKRTLKGGIARFRFTSDVPVQYRLVPAGEPCPTS